MIRKHKTSRGQRIKARKILGNRYWHKTEWQRRFSEALVEITVNSRWEK